MATKSKMPFVVVRTRYAGVHFGELSDRRGTEVDLANARRLWSWTGANTLHEVALHGVGDKSRISEPVEAITLTEVIEVITGSSEARANLEKSRWA